MDFDCPRLVWRPVCNPFDDGITACCGLPMRRHEVNAIFSSSSGSSILGFCMLKLV